MCRYLEIASGALSYIKYMIWTHVWYAGRVGGKLQAVTFGLSLHWSLQTEESRYRQL